MGRLQVFAFTALSVLAASGSAFAQVQEVYQWKDANGVTHYSQTPPAQGQYQQRAITHKGASQPQAATGGEEPVENAQCTSARENLAALRSGDTVHEAGADGHPGRALNAEERANQTELANAAIKAYCRNPGG